MNLAIINAKKVTSTRNLSLASFWTSFCSPPLTRAFVARRKIDVMRAMGADAREEIAALRARIERHARSLEGEDRASFLALPDHAYALGLPHE